jgi:hypothetical protein
MSAFGHGRPAISRQMRRHLLHRLALAVEWRPDTLGCPGILQEGDREILWHPHAVLMKNRQRDPRFETKLTKKHGHQSSLCAMAHLCRFLPARYVKRPHELEHQLHGTRMRRFCRRGARHRRWFVPKSRLPIAIIEDEMVDCAHCTPVQTTPIASTPC